MKCRKCDSPIVFRKGCCQHCYALPGLIKKRPHIAIETLEEMGYTFEQVTLKALINKWLGKGHD